MFGRRHRRQDRILGFFDEVEATNEQLQNWLGAGDLQKLMLKADLSKFGIVEGNTLTCNLHGWQWNLDNGRCLTSKGHELRSAKR